MTKNKSMRKIVKKGFTIIEVSLFLVISTAILAVIMSNTAATIARRRYNDSVQGFVEEIRNAYSATINVENYRVATQDSSYFCSITSGFLNGSLTVNSGVNRTSADNYPGRTKCAVYGQILTFGEDGKSDIHRYDLIGLASQDAASAVKMTKKIDIEADSDETLAGLSAVGANIITMTQVPIDAARPDVCIAGLAGTTSIYHPQWSGTIENKEDRGLYHGAIMIARSPVSGTVHTYFYSAYGDIARDNPDDGAFDVQEWLKNTSGQRGCIDFGIYKDRFAAVNRSRWINKKDLDICVGSEDLFATGNHRRAIRIHGDGATESSVELLSEVDSNTVCKVVET